MTDERDCIVCQAGGACVAHAPLFRELHDDVVLARDVNATATRRAELPARVPRNSPRRIAREVADLELEWERAEIAVGGGSR